MGWTFSSDPDDFLRAAEPFLHRRPVENSIHLTVSAKLRRRGLTAYGPTPPAFGWWRPAEGGSVEAAFLHTPPLPPLLTRAPAAAARELAEQWPGRPPGGARGDHEAVAAFAAAWTARTGQRHHVAVRTRIHALGELTPRRPGPPGRHRVADSADRALLLRWEQAARAELGDPLSGAADAVDDAIVGGLRTLWLTPDGTPVAMAGRTTEAAGSIRVVGVYTPPEHRGKGYAGGVVTAVSQAALATGARHVLLVTDLANPVSNGLYHRLGYRPVRDGLHVAFTPGGARHDGTGPA
ncbi:GNAT family N-acetyltransferase [Actinacidiphila epipremni]|jgi:RimJ/RimL family protein N-acetyltransferase|uniref:GNAT family N-acetyltransferase n=1 Tax=Actinacidiphila epipremni TaxID=2053013 RepID=A0ABX0ZRS9_9ACTN|nr:GNAT family N-acetyltransferase [Actinacidiphila epipremni]NJP44311.1 GNAT family N-acetyltransferase [Actinacidiphila epipremni]